MAYSIPASLVSNTVLTSGYMNIIAQDFSVLSVHNHSGSLGEGSSLLQAASSGSTVAGSGLYRLEAAPSSGTTTSGSLATNITLFSPALLGGGNWNASVPRSFTWYVAGASGFGISTCGIIFYPFTQGTYLIEMYYISTPSGGVFYVTDTASTLITTVDTYSSPSVLNKMSASFYVNTDGASGFTRVSIIGSASSNPLASATLTTFSTLGAFSVRWVAS